jgi:hypothetical protein
MRRARGTSLAVSKPGLQLGPPELLVCPEELA